MVYLESHRIIDMIPSRETADVSKWLTTFPNIIQLTMENLLSVYGKNENFARYTGISVLTVIFAAQAIGGFIGGMAGSIEILGMYRRFQYTASPQYGFDGIIIATAGKWCARHKLV